MGCTTDWAVDETRLLPFAHEKDFVLVAPQALRPKQDVPARFLTNAPRWNDSGRTDPPNADDVGFLDAVLTDALARSGADPNRVFVVGFSNGAAMTFRFVAERAERIAAMAPVAGHCQVEKPGPSRPVPTLYVIGARDPLIPLRGGEIELPWGNRLVRRPPVIQTLERWASGIQCSAVSLIDRDDRELRVEHFPGPVLYRCVTVHDLGHHWPGGKGQLNPRIGGAVSNTINANELLWNFFLEVTHSS